MVNPQEWLENEYPNKENATQIYIGDSDTLNLNLGELIIADYPNLEGIYACGSKGTVIKNITKVTIHHCPRLKKININDFVDNQQLEIRECENLEILKCGNNQLTSLEIRNCQGLKTISCCKNKLTKLDLTNLEKLEVLGCWENQLTELDLSQNKLLTEIYCYRNKLTQLTLPNQLDNLQKLVCRENNLDSLDFLKSCQLPKLETLSLGNNNFPTQGLEIFTSFGELKVLCIERINKLSNFTGSLKPLQELKNLEILDIGGTDITHGLEYLPESVKEIVCTPYRSDAKVIDIYEELQPFGSDLSKWRTVKLEKKPYLLTSPLLPPQLTNKKEDKSTQFPERNEQESELINQPTQKINYDQTHFNQWNNITQPYKASNLPIRLYDIRNRWVEGTYNELWPNPNIENYAVISYVWGKPTELKKEIKDWLGNIWSKVGYKNNLNYLGYKALYKAIKTCECLNKEVCQVKCGEVCKGDCESLKVNHLWIDQLCINQNNPNEKVHEVTKMRQYYSNSTVTLIALQDEVGNLQINDLMDILKKIVDSEWFTRSWCFQEGWLSKHTIFMFDDKLVDGRAMAGVWALNQLAYAEGGKYLSRSEFDRGTKKIATPVGWVYYRDGYDENDKVEMTLTQALYAIKNRKRSISVDGIYSILGLLPYGEEVAIDYSENNTPEQALVEVMKVAIANGYAEPLSWHGESNESEGLCCLPKIDERGSTSIVGSVGKVNSIYKGVPNSNREEDINLISLTNQGIEFDAKIPHYLIHQTNQNTHKLESGFEIEGGLFRKEVVVKPREMEEEIKLSLLGTKETLEAAEKGNILVVFYKEYYGTNKLFALLVKKTNQTNTYHRLGLVELANSEGIKFTTWADNFTETIIGSNQYQTQIQIPPKK